MVKSTEQHFIQHFITVLKERIDELSPMSKAPNEFEAGKSLAYHEIADLVIECSRVFNINLNDVGINDFDPDKLL